MKIEERLIKILDHLDFAFGGRSQVSYETIGDAIIGQVNNNGLVAFDASHLEEVVANICDGWDEWDEEYEKECRLGIFKGMKEKVKNWPRQENKHVYHVLDKIEAHMKGWSYEI